LYRIIAKQTCVEIHGYDLGDKPEIERLFTVYDDVTHKLIPKGFDYNEEERILYLPRGMNIGLIEKVCNAPIEMDRGYNNFNKAVYKLTTEPRDDNQVKSIAYLIGEGDFRYTKRYSQQSLNLDVGQGKTYVTIAASTFLQMNTMIITHQDGIKEQWIESFNKFTNIDPQCMCNIDSSKKLNKILTLKKIPYKVFFINHGTIKSWCKKNGWDKLNDVMQTLGIGLKVFDEAHLEFSSVLKIDFNTNVFKTFYLTATFERSQYGENNVFNNCFKNIAKFGIEVKESLRKHIVYLAVKFNSHPSVSDIINVKGVKGFDRYAYINYQLKDGTMMKVIDYVIDYLKNQEGKMLVLSSSIESSFAIKDHLIELYPDRKTIAWNSQVSDEEKAENVNADFISSTPKSLGTGSDIRGLRFLIMTEPYTSSVSANQISGRLREYAPDMYTFYIELVDIGFPKVVNMYRKRLSVLKKRCVSINEIIYKDE
jgi:superfamily II DNA or RNA helicase